MSSSFGSVGKKDENRRTLTDFKIVGLEIRDLGWTWGVLPSLPVKIEAKDEDEDVPEVSQVAIKHEAIEEDGSLKPAAPVDEGAVKHEADTDASGAVELMNTTAESKPASHENSSAACPRPSSDSNSSSPPPSRIRIYFHTPVTADDSHPIPHNSLPSFSLTVAPSDSRKGKRKKLEDDDGDLEEGRGRPPPPQMASGMSDDRSSVAASVAPSIAETASEADWLMAAIVAGEGELDPEGDDNEDGDQLHVSQIVEANVDDGVTDGGADTDTDGEPLYIALKHRASVWTDPPAALRARRLLRAHTADF